jgi:hypothetical protein
VQIKWLLACVALVGSGAQSNSGSGGMGSAYAVHPSSAVGPSAAGPRTPSLDESVRQDYPLRHYRSFPPAIRPLLRRADIEHGHCHANPGDNFQACNRSDRIERQLERRGWCWGSELPLPSEADKHWLRCSNDPRRRRR